MQDNKKLELQQKTVKLRFYQTEIFLQSQEIEFQPVLTDQLFQYLMINKYIISINKLKQENKQ